MKALFDEAEVRKTLARIIKHGAVFEVRALDAKLSGNHRAGTVSGYFNNPDACVAELRKLTSAKGIYVTLNPVNPALLAPVTNRNRGSLFPNDLRSSLHGNCNGSRRDAVGNDNKLARAQLLVCWHIEMS
jgi:hypothetical protein